MWGNNAGEDKRIILSQEAAAHGYALAHRLWTARAVYRLERMGLRVKATGVGHVVRQSIAPGTKVQRGMRVGLLLSLNDDRHLSENEDLAFRRMYGLPIEKKDSTQKTADSSRTAAVKSENSVVSNSDNKKQSLLLPTTAERAKRTRNKSLVLRRLQSLPPQPPKAPPRVLPHQRPKTPRTRPLPIKKTPKGSKS